MAAVMSIDKLHVPQGQYGCTGHVTHLPQDYHFPIDLDVIFVGKR